MSREELIAENQAIKDQNSILSAKLESLTFQLSQLQKMVFGAKRERFVPEIADNQLNLFSEHESDDPREENLTEEISFTRKKKKKHPGRNAFPEHLRVQEETIEPEEDTTDMVRIGQEVSDTVEYTPASLFIRRIIRPKYAPKQGEGAIVIASLPSKPIDKGIAGSSLLAWLLVSKFVEHMPFYRMRQRFKREYDWEVPSSTINDWFIAVCSLLKPLYDHMHDKILESGYIPENATSHMRVINSKEKTHSASSIISIYLKTTNH